MAQRLRGRATSAVAAGLAAACLAMAAGPAFADTVRNQEWWLSSLHVTNAWLSSRGSGVTVAVLNTGVDPGQPDLAGSVTTGRDFTGSGRSPGGQFWGANGTAVASLIAGHGHGPQHADGIIGVAPLAKILSIRVTLEAGDPLLANPATVAALPRAIARGISAAVRQGAQVIDLPLDPATLASGNTPGGSPLERGAVEAALRKGVVLVAPGRRQRRRDGRRELPGRLPRGHLGRRVQQQLHQGGVQQQPVVRDADRPRGRRHLGQRDVRLRQAGQHHRRQRGGGGHRGPHQGAVSRPQPGPGGAGPDQWHRVPSRGRPAGGLRCGDGRR